MHICKLNTPKHTTNSLDSYKQCMCALNCHLQPSYTKTVSRSSLVLCEIIATIVQSVMSISLAYSLLSNNLVNGRPEAQWCHLVPSPCNSCRLVRYFSGTIAIQKYSLSYSANYFLIFIKLCGYRINTNTGVAPIKAPLRGILYFSRSNCKRLRALELILGGT